MGIKCCPPSRELIISSNSSQITTEVINDTSAYMKPVSTVNEVRTIPIHESRKMVEMKCLNNLNVSTSQTTRYVQKRKNSVANKMRSNLLYMKCPTNFKIEPGHFRVEKKKETLNDRYIIKEAIGQGNFGVVKRIKDKETKLYRAIKIINKANCQEIDNLVDEIKIIKSLVSLKCNN